LPVQLVLQAVPVVAAEAGGNGRGLRYVHGLDRRWKFNWRPSNFFNAVGVNLGCSKRFSFNDRQGTLTWTPRTRIWT